MGWLLTNVRDDEGESENWVIVNGEGEEVLRMRGGDPNFGAALEAAIDGYEAEHNHASHMRGVGLVQRIDADHWVVFDPDDS